MVRQHSARSKLHFELCVGTGNWRALWIGGRNNVRGPGFFETDAGIFRTFTLSESVNLQFRAEALNATNHANFANPQSDINNATFGFITSLYGPNQSRQWRFGMRLGF